MPAYTFSSSEVVVSGVIDPDPTLRRSLLFRMPKVECYGVCGSGKCERCWMEHGRILEESEDCEIPEVEGLGQTCRISRGYVKGKSDGKVWKLGGRGTAYRQQPPYFDVQPHR